MSTENSPTGTITEALTAIGNLKSESAQEKQDTVKGPTCDFGCIPIPRRLRYDSNRHFHFGMLLNILFGFASTFNMYWSQPILITLSQSFNVSYAEVSRIPTLVQAGYAIGLVLITPLGDLVRRRQVVLLLVLCSSTLTIGLAVTNSLIVFEILTFLIGAASVTPQILLPLAADLAPPERRAAAISLVLSGLMFGILIARVISGAIAEYASWRDVYCLAIGVQCIVLAASYFFIPDYPAKNAGLTYWSVLWSMAKYAVTEPTLVQASLVQIASNACFTNFWVTLTFLLGGPPYYYSTLVIGLFGLIGMAGVSTGPFLGLLVDRLVPWYSTLFSTSIWTLFQAIETGAGGVNVGAVIVVTFGADVCRQMQQLSLTTAVFSVSEEARSRLNAVLILSAFIGQVMGTALGTKVFVEYGWRAASWLSMAWFAFQILVMLVRGPHVERYTWFGYEGGMEARRSAAKKRRQSLVREDAAAAASGFDLSGKDQRKDHPSCPENPRSREIEIEESRGDLYGRV